jgi:hypothetical protein
MPNKQIDYSRNVIYKIVCKDLEISEVYVGHTTDFTRRKCSHKRACQTPTLTREHNLHVYHFIREHGGWENWDMIEIEKYPCEDGNEANKRERHWYEQLDAKLNTNCPHRPKQEGDKIYRDSHKDERRQRDEKNKEKIREQQKKYKQNNIDRINEMKRLNYHKNKDNNKEEKRIRNNENARNYNKRKREMKNQANKTAEIDAPL